MIHQLLVDLTLDFLQNVGKKAIVTIDGIDHEYDFKYTEIVGNTVKKYVYLSTEQGQVTNARVVDNQGRNLETYTASIEKGPDGFMVVFYLTLEINGEVSA